MLWQNKCVDSILFMFVWCLLPKHSVSPLPFLPQEELHPGCKVRLKALHVQRNGQLGVVEDYVAPRQRWRVRLVASGKCHDFKALLETFCNEIPQIGWPKMTRKGQCTYNALIKEKGILWWVAHMVLALLSCCWNRSTILQSKWP